MINLNFGQLLIGESCRIPKFPDFLFGLFLFISLEFGIYDILIKFLQRVVVFVLLGVIDCVERLVLQLAGIERSLTGRNRWEVNGSTE
jgi:hypothetical protein